MHRPQALVPVLVRNAILHRARVDSAFQDRPSDGPVLFEVLDGSDCLEPYPRFDELVAVDEIAQRGVERS